MPFANKQTDVSKARQDRRAHILAAAGALVGAEVGKEFDAVHSPLCPVDVVMVAGAPWLSDGLERDFAKDESGYKKVGGGANTPAMAYFFRSPASLIHYLKRQGFYIPRGRETPAMGMACFFDWDDRGRFNFAPDRSGVVLKVDKGHVSEVVMAVKKGKSAKSGYVVKQISVTPGDEVDRALIGYSDLP